MPRQAASATLLRLLFPVLFATAGAGMARAESVLHFPRLANEPGTITGVAFVNPNPEAVQLRLTAYRADGVQLAGPGIENPVDLVVPANQQIGMLTSQIFGNGVPTDTVGWFRATSPADGVTGFFLFLNNAGTLFDGAGLPPLDRKVVFNQVRVDGGFTTEINLVNTENLSSRIDLLLVDGADVLEIDPEETDFVLAPMGAARLEVGDAFGVDSLSDGAYLLAISDTNVAGFQFVRGPSGDLLGLNARGAADYLNAIYFPQLAVRGPWLMEIGLVNYSTEPVSLVLTAYRPDGEPFGPPTVARNQVVRQLGGGGSLRENVEAMFGFTGDAALDGWIEVESTGRSVNGYVSYGIPAVGSVAAVAAVAQPQRRAIFSHVATTLGFFTGVAALNPSASAASVRFVALTREGEVLGSADRVLRPGERISRLITELIPQAAGQAGGVIWVRSDTPIFLTSLFGTNTGSVLANIPPQPAPDGYEPDAGLPRLTVTPAFAVLGPGQEQQFQAEGAADPSWEANSGAVDPAGLYQPPAPFAPGSVTVTAAADGLAAAATADLLGPQEVLSGLANPGPLAYLEESGRLFAAIAGNGAQSLPSGAVAARENVVRVRASGVEATASLAGDDIGGILPFRAFDGSEYLLVTGRQTGRLLRLDPDSGQFRELLSGLDQPHAIARDPLSGSFLVADGGGVWSISGALPESDLLSDLDSNGAPPRRVLDASNLGGLAVDGCNGNLYYSDRAAGEIREYAPASSSSRVVASGLDQPGVLLALQRRDTGCSGSFHLLAHEEGAGRLLLVGADGGSPLSWSEASAVGGLAWMSADNSLLESEAVVFTERPAAEGRVTAIAVPALYQERAVNPPGAAVGALADPPLDTYHFFEDLVHDIVELTAVSDGTNLNVRVVFSDTISPCEQAPDALQFACDGTESPVDSVAGLIALDVDQDAGTGLSSFLDANSPYSSVLGAEFCVDFFRYNTAAGGVEIYQAVDGRFVLAGRLAVTFTAYDLSFAIPLTLLGDDGRVNIAAVFGPSSPEVLNLGPTDTVPNGGFLTSAAGSPAAGQSVTVQREGASAKASERLVPIHRLGGWKRLLGKP